MSLLIMPTDRILSKDRLSPSWMRRSISWRKKSPQESDSQLSTASTLLSPHSTTSRTNSDESRSTQLTKSGNSSAFRGVVNRLRSSSSASSLGGKSQGTDFNDIHDWFQGFRSYNQLVTTNISNQQSYNPQEFTNTTKALTKNCGGRILHGLPEGAFDFSLLWCPASQGTKRESGEPSWSWTAHEGQVIFPFDPTTCPDVYTAPKNDGEIFRSEIVHFHVGPKDAQYTVRREKGGTLRTKYPPYFHAPRGSEINVESNTLRFTASTISADDFVVEQLEYQGKSIPCSQLMDEENKQWGVIMDFESTLSEPSALGPFEFVLLSRNLRREPASHTRKPANPTIHPPGTPIWDGECFVWDQEVVEFDEEVFEDGPWKMLNVMLIKWVGEHAERVAIARIHESAWLAKSPVRKEIVLR